MNRSPCVWLAALLSACGSADADGLFGSVGGAGGAPRPAGRGGALVSGGTGPFGTGATPPTPTASSTASDPDGGSLTSDAGAGSALADAELAADAPAFPAHLSHLADCDYTGSWATFIRVPVSWPAAPLVLLAGSGDIYQWNLSHRRHVSPLETVEDSVPCGIFLPDLQADVLQVYQRYGIRFPDRLFDLRQIPPATFNANATIGADLAYQTDVIATLVGLTMPNPATGAWPPATYTPEDHDVDGEIGVTVWPVEAEGYNYPPVGLPPVPFAELPRARSIYVITRSVAKLTGTVESCDELGGEVNIQTVAGTPGINSTVIGCVKLDGTDCIQTEWEFINDNRPQFVPTGAGEFTSVRLPDDATCRDVRARFPTPQ